MDASVLSGFEFLDDTTLRSWYLQDGQIPIPTLDRAHTLEMIKEGQMQTPLQLVALIQQEHPIIHKPWWTRVYLPMFCPTRLALEEMYKHWWYFIKRNEGRVHDFSLTSKKMAFHLGYTLQVFWILATQRPSCRPLNALMADPQPMMHFSNTKPNIRYLANFFGMLCLKRWQMRLSTTQGQETARVPNTFQFETWKNSKGSMDNWRDLEGALATLWRIFTQHEEVLKEGTGFGLQFPVDLGSMRDWEFIHLSAEEEQWFGISTSGDGPGQMSPLALGLKEAERVQRHWEKEKKWVDPMYPAEWEGWSMV